MKKFVFSILLCFLLSNVYSMPKYNIVDLGALGGNYSHAVDINDNNQNSWLLKHRNKCETCS